MTTPTRLRPAPAARLGEAWRAVAVIAVALAAGFAPLALQAADPAASGTPSAGLQGMGHADGNGVPATRQRALVHIVRQDCGSCHGMRLKGGLGPALTPEALADRPLAALVATILQGRPGTPMPGWHNMLDEADARWIATRLQGGFPEEQEVQP